MSIFENYGDVKLAIGCIMYRDMRAFFPILIPVLTKIFINLVCQYGFQARWANLFQTTTLPGCGM